MKSTKWRKNSKEFVAAIVVPFDSNFSDTDEEIEKLAGVQASSSGAGFGERDMSFGPYSFAKIRRIAKRLLSHRKVDEVNIVWQDEDDSEHVETLTKE